MIADLPFQPDHDDAERNAFNAAFYELGFRWHWDGETYAELQRHASNHEDRIRHYLETRHPHLLKAYDADFLIGVIQEKKTLLRNHRAARGNAASPHFDWAQTLAGELGA